MSKGDKDARALQDATGAKYMTCLARVRSLRALAPIPMESSDGCRFEKALDSFMHGVEALSGLVDGQTRCVTCLHDRTPAKRCTCG
jgi:hypothetical protein